MITCKKCGNEIRITCEGLFYACSCGSLECCNFATFQTLKEAALHAEDIHGWPFTKLSWEGQLLKSRGEWLI